MTIKCVLHEIQSTAPAKNAVFLCTSHDCSQTTIKCVLHDTQSSASAEITVAEWCTSRGRSQITLMCVLCEIQSSAHAENAVAFGYQQRLILRLLCENRHTDRESSTQKKGACSFYEDSANSSRNRNRFEGVWGFTFLFVCFLVIMKIVQILEGMNELSLDVSQEANESNMSPSSSLIRWSMKSYRGKPWRKKKKRKTHCVNFNDLKCATHRTSMYI